MSDDVISRSHHYDTGQDRELHTSQRLRVEDTRVTHQVGPIGELDKGVAITSTDRNVVRFHRKVVIAMRRYGRRHSQVRPAWKLGAGGDAAVAGVCPACQDTREVWRGPEETGRLIPCPLCANQD